MKKIMLLLVVAGVLSSCGTTKIERQAQRTFKGDWTLTEITYPNGIGLVDVRFFDDASRDCFLQSDWHFVSNNNKGYYQLYKSDCTPGKRNFYWTVKNNTDAGMYYFTLKPAKNGKQARHTDKGYRLKLVSLNDTQMIWEETVPTAKNRPLLIRFKFHKN